MSMKDPCEKCGDEDSAVLCLKCSQPEKLRVENEKLRSMLRRLEFSFGPGGMARKPYGKCPVCLGWDNSPSGNGETPMRHTKDCELAGLLR